MKAYFWRRPQMLTVGIIFSLLWASVGQVHTQRSAREIPTPNPQQIEQLRERGKSVRLVRQMLLEQNVPFEPFHLFSKSWRMRLARAFNTMPAMQTNIDHTSPNLSGVKIANELRLPEQTRLTGDTVIIARNIVYQGRNVVIRGPFSLHIFVVDTTRTSSSGGTVTIDTSGHGRSEWLQTRGKVSQISATQSSVSFVRASFGGASVPVQSGQHGADGSQGIPGVSGQHGSGGGSGAAGACEGNINGGNGSAAANAGDGDYGGDGGNGGNGGNGQTVTLRISNPNDATPYNLVTRGGNGGFGGNGAYAGNGGNGGTGGNGGNGASCECKVNGVGNGGNGGNGGRAGSGGTGGDGGNGGNGGNGGSIEVYYPAGYNTNNVTYNNGGGAAGSPGTAGAGGQPGLIGSAGSPGTGGSVSSCNGSNGNGGTGGSAGSGGAGGSGGDGGSAGNAGGPPTFVQVGGGYGGGWEPGGTGYGGCTEWYWVEFECYLLDRPQFDPYHKLSFGNSPGQKLTLVNAFIDKSASGPSPESEMSSEEWECSVISSTYIGCW